MVQPRPFAVQCSNYSGSETKLITTDIGRYRKYIGSWTLDSETRFDLTMDEEPAPRCVHQFFNVPLY